MSSGKEMEYIELLGKQIQKLFDEMDDRIHRGIVGPCPERFTGLEEALWGLEGAFTSSKETFRGFEEALKR